MASPIWIGGAPAVAQIDTVSIPTDIEAGQTVNFTIGNKTLAVTLTGATQAAVVAELVAAWNASTIPEFAEIIASVGTEANDEEDGTIDLTSRTAGKPFAVTTSIGSGNNEKQVVTLGGTAATGGTFTLTFNGETTTTIAYNASAATVESALEGLASYSSGDFTVTGSAGGPYTVEFTETLAGTNVSIMTIDVSGLTGGVNEIQTITSPNNPSGGTFRLKFVGEWTGNIAYNASAATIETALLALVSIPAGAVSCGGGALPGTDVTVTFQGALARTDVALLQVDSSSLTGVTGSAAETTAGGSTLLEKIYAYFSFDSNYTDSIEGISLSESGSGLPAYIAPGGKINSALWIDSTGTTYLRNTSNTDFAKWNYDVGFTCAFWFKADSLNTWKLVERNAASATDWSVTLNSGGTLTFYRRDSSTSFTVTSSGSVSANTWNHVACVYDPDNNLIKISLNGAAFDTAAVSATGATPSESSAVFRLYGGGALYAVWFDELALFSDALSISECQALYNSGDGDQYPFPDAGENEVQTLTLAGSPTSGSVNVSYQGVGVDIPYDATAAEAEALLESISTIGSGNVSVTGGDWPGTALVVEFIGALSVTNVELLEIDTSSLVMSVSETTKGVTDPTGTVETTVTPLSQSTTTPNSGPNNWDVAANWNTNTVPVNGDTPYIADSDIDILYGLDQSAVTLAALHIEQTFTGTIGLPRINTDGGTESSYYEYRETYLKIGATELFIGEKEGDGSERIKINLGSVQSTVLITDSGESPDGNTPPILLLGTHASNVINVNRGSLGVAYYPTEVSTVATLRQAFFDDATDDTTVYLGAGVTVTNITKTGGVLDINSGTTSFQQTAGTTTIHDGAHTVLNILAGLVNYNSTGTLAAVNLSGDAVLVFDQDARPKTVTVINKYSDDSEVYDESGSIASPVIQLHNCGDMSTLFMGKDFKLTFSATT
ncbi:LamG-like jellyroll fold domain-containing protein [Gimesia sp.]|uniref:LamG-like jellyroll fold domain-containing protein n=1 Tax=Gimesia sp. TaxID=2024833 RepID=UPI0032EE4ACB